MARNKLVIYATEEFVNDSKKLLSLNLSHLKLFKNTFKREDKFDFDEDFIDEYLNEVKIDVNNLSSISAVVKFINKYILEKSLTPDEIGLELQLLAEKSGVN